MKARPQGGVNLSKSVKDDIRKMFNSLLDKYNRDACVQFLFVMHFTDGYGQKRLEHRASELMRLQKELKERYELDDDDTPWLCEELLRRDGIDIDKILRGDFGEDKPL